MHVKCKHELTLFLTGLLTELLPLAPSLPPIHIFNPAQEHESFSISCSPLVLHLEACKQKSSPSGIFFSGEMVLPPTLWVAGIFAWDRLNQVHWCWKVQEVSHSIIKSIYKDVFKSITSTLVSLVVVGRPLLGLLFCGPIQKAWYDPPGLFWRLIWLIGPR